eukprot:TRINITY_DN34026_c0_g1_i4.p1 TRINITY_DN34026_c0_g1~~TRINITY_DN34026_c0_g1_i4.p1  ORF type:complete len:207 (-),score=33.98 TRINITY_DN34026_c0_g1_i4:28-648(-)
MLPSDEQQVIMTMRYLWSTVNAFGVLAGFQGLLGVTTGNEQRVRWLLCYLLWTAFMSIPSTAYEVDLVCDVRAAVAEVRAEELAGNATEVHGEHMQPMLSCEASRWQLVRHGLVYIVIQLTFAHAVWSFAKHLEAGRSLSLLRDPLMPNGPAPPAGLHAHPQPIFYPLGLRGAAEGGHPSALPRLGRAPQLEPFTGQAHRLEEEVH